MIREKDKVTTEKVTEPVSQNQICMKYSFSKGGWQSTLIWGENPEVVKRLAKQFCGANCNEKYPPKNTGDSCPEYVVKSVNSANEPFTMADSAQVRAAVKQALGK